MPGQDRAVRGEDKESRGRCDDQGTGWSSGRTRPVRDHVDLRDVPSDPVDFSECPGIWRKIAGSNEISDPGGRLIPVDPIIGKRSAVKVRPLAGRLRGSLVRAGEQLDDDGPQESVAGLHLPVVELFGRIVEEDRDDLLGNDVPESSMPSS